MRKSVLMLYISVLKMYISVRLMCLNSYPYDVFFDYKKMVKKGYMEMKGFFLLRDSYEVRQTNQFYTTPHNHKCQFDIKCGSLSMQVALKISY